MSATLQDVPQLDTVQPEKVKKAKKPKVQRSSKETANSLWAAFKEFFGFTSPRIIFALFATSLVARVVVGGWTWWDLVIPAVIFALWPLQEWVIHVFVLHMKPIKLGKHTFDLNLAKSHRHHHEHPWSLPDIFVPIRDLLTAIPIVVAVWWLITPTWALFWMGMMSYALMSFGYEWSHYLIHSRYRPKSAFYKRMWQHHRWHHCKNEHYWFGVSRIGADKLLGTSPDHKDVEVSPTCRTLGVTATSEQSAD